MIQIVKKTLNDIKSWYIFNNVIYLYNISNILNNNRNYFNIEILI